MALIDRNPITDAAWELTKKQFPEWTAPKTENEGISDEEKSEDVNYSDESHECVLPQNKM